MGNYDKWPCTYVKMNPGNAWQGYTEIVKKLRADTESIKSERVILSIDCYSGVDYEELKENLIDQLNAKECIFTDDEIFKSEKEITARIKDRITDDRVFGQMCLECYKDLLDEHKIKTVRKDLESVKGLVIVYGVGASLLVKPDIYVYADLARWEIQQRYRNNTIQNWKNENPYSDALMKFKWGYFFEWRIADRHKKKQLTSIDYLLDTNKKDMPKMITGKAFRKGLEQTVQQPFRVVPFFDPGVWGGQWMKETFDLESEQKNYAWCFDCVLEENSLLLEVDNIIVEVPAMDLVLFSPLQLLGEKVFARFGAEFPIRFDMLDTMGGQNLSLQVHPTVDYIQEKFGMHYTQEESYYILDTKEESKPLVYLGVSTDTNKEDFFTDLTIATDRGNGFSVDKYINQIPVKKHDHILIPPGTLHCSGSDTMVLEISATPYIFTFKLWDWERLGLDGKPRPINIEHGKEVLNFERDTSWVKEHLINNIQALESGNGWRSERTGLHELELIETVRHWFSVPVIHHTNGSVNVLNLVEGSEAIVESPTGQFDPFVVHYAETFIIPESVGEYSIRPYNTSEGKEIATIKANVRI